MELRRKGLIYTMASLFVAWHTLAIVVAPMSEDSEAVQSLRTLLYPYLTLFRLDNQWDFYAPEAGNRHQFRYVIEDAAGKRYSFTPADALNWYYPTYWWFRAWYDAIVDYPDDYGDSAAAVLCRKHAALKPVAITFLKVEEQDFSPTDHLNGKHPLDPEFVTVSTVKHVKCKDQ